MQQGLRPYADGALSDVLVPTSPSATKVVTASLASSMINSAGTIGCRHFFGCQHFSGGEVVSED